MNWIRRTGVFLPGLLLLPLLFAVGCMDEKAEQSKMLRAVRITSNEQLIGGPSARGKIGDYLIENDKVRFIVAGRGQTWMGGVFGGSLIDADKRRWWPEFRYGKGYDSFSETFPLVNLVVANPELPGRILGAQNGGLQLQAIPSGIEVLKKGNEGDGEAIIRVTGRAGYMFEALKFLNKDFLMSFIAEPIELFGFKLPIDQLLNMFLKVNVYSLLNRLQLEFLFYNDYVLHEGESYLTIRTTIITSPPSEAAVFNCPEVIGCKLTCDDGFVLQEVEYEIPGQTTPTPGKVMCPKCECAAAPETMMSLNESEDIFQIMLGDLGPWKDPAWKGGLLGGDFLFFGSEANIFTPGLGFDEDRKIYENMWQEVPTLASPLIFDWVSAVADNVSYGWVTVNPDRRDGADCPTWRLAIVTADYEQEEILIATLVEKLGINEDVATSRVRHVIVDRRPYPLKELELPAGTTDLEAWQESILKSTTLPIITDPEKPDETTPTKVTDLLPKGIGLALIPATECQASKLLIPIFSTSATGVMTHKSLSALEMDNATPLDRTRTYTFERYFVVGDGDVGSVLDTIYEIKGEPTGRVKGAVFDEGTQTPVPHANVFAMRDPRLSDSDPLPATYDELVALAVKRFGNSGFVSQMQSDRGFDEVIDGNYSGPLPPDSYLLVAFTADRGMSRPVPVTITTGETSVAHLLIPAEGTISYKIYNDGGTLVPCRLTFLPLTEDGSRHRWEGNSRVELGGSRYGYGINKQEHSASGMGEITLPAGDYEIYVSRGFEYSIEHFDKFTVKAGQTAQLEAVLVHEVDTSGWISGDFHVHCQPSIDSSLPMTTRVTANAAEGIEFIVATDHDILVDYTPFIHDLGLDTMMTSAVGVETTTLEFGHFNGYPLEYDHTDVPVFNPPPWYGMHIGDVWQEMRNRIQKGINPDNFVVQVNHPRDGFMGYFDQFGLVGYDLQRATPGMEMCNQQTEKISCDFDAIELMNEKRFELLRTPTVGEMNMHNRCFEDIMAATRQAQFTGSADAICASLRQEPHNECSTLPDLQQSQATGLELAHLYSIRDHCLWHNEFADGIKECTDDMHLVECKRQALESLKMMTIRYMMERTPEEQAAFFATTAATDVGCDYDSALLGTTELTDDKGEFTTGCGGEDCACEVCVCTTLGHQECCEKPGGGDNLDGTGWTGACADICLSQCHGGAIRPCTSETQIFDDWFAFLNHGFNKTGVGNSDSHDTKAEVGLPRNWVPANSDSPNLLDPNVIYQNIKKFRVVLSTGPFVEFTINGAMLGDTITKPEGSTLKAHLKVQTPSWFGIDHIEIHRNGILEEILRIAPEPTAIVDFDDTIELPMPTEDSWYVVIVYGLDAQYLMSPVYKQMPLGKILIPTIISLGAQSILISFQSVLTEVENELGGLMGEGGIDSLLGGLMGLAEKPDSFPMLPFAATNPIWVDLDGSGWKPPAYDESEQLADGSWPLPPFCSQSCDVAQARDPDDNPLVDDDGKPVWDQSTCGTGQLCLPDSDGATMGTCQIPIPANCVGSQVSGE